MAMMRMWPLEARMKLDANHFTVALLLAPGPGWDTGHTPPSGVQGTRPSSRVVRGRVPWGRSSAAAPRFARGAAGAAAQRRAPPRPTMMHVGLVGVAGDARP